MLMELAPEYITGIVIVSVIGGVLAICAIVFGVVTIVRIATRHRERMAAIGMGLDPDQPPAGPNRTSSPSVSQYPSEPGRR